jgi:hypothetical protein
VLSEDEHGANIEAVGGLVITLAGRVSSKAKRSAVCFVQR